jgi:hypothetical protein
MPSIMLMKYTQPLLTSLLILGSASASGQGSMVDYERADALRERYNGKVSKQSLDANWLPDGNSFWYRNDLRDGKREFILVDAERGLRNHAFDHDRLAIRLAEELGTDVDPQRLPIRHLKFGEDGKSLTLIGKARSWRWKPGSDELERVELDPQGNESTVEVLAEPRPSRRTGGETSILFVNRSGKLAELLWIGTNGKRRAYAKVNPGESHSQHTFSGHVWIAVDPDGKLLNTFAAKEMEGLAIIDGKAPARRERKGRGNREETFTSPDGRFRAFFRNHNLHLRDLRE